MSEDIKIPYKDFKVILRGWGDGFNKEDIEEFLSSAKWVMGISGIEIKSIEEVNKKWFTQVNSRKRLAYSKDLNLD